LRSDVYGTYMAIYNPEWALCDVLSVWYTAQISCEHYKLKYVWRNSNYLSRVLNYKPI